MIGVRTLKKKWLKLRIAHHRGQAQSYSRPVIRSFRRDHYRNWLGLMALRHTQKAHALEQELLREYETDAGLAGTAGDRAG